MVLLFILLCNFFLEEWKSDFAKLCGYLQTKHITKQVQLYCIHVVGDFGQLTQRIHPSDYSRNKITNLFIMLPKPWAWPCRVKYAVKFLFP